MHTTATTKRHRELGGRDDGIRQSMGVDAESEEGLSVGSPLRVHWEALSARREGLDVFFGQQ